MLAAAVLVALPACANHAGIRPPVTTTSAAPAGASTTAAPVGSPVTTMAYFVREERIAAVQRAVPPTVAPATAILTAVLGGPSTAEAAQGYTSAIPPGTTLLGITIRDRVATVDLSGAYESGGGSLSMNLRLAQVVYTLTQFATVDGVDFRVDGRDVGVFSGEGIVLDRPARRSSFEDVTPAIFVESPPAFASVTTPLTVRGTANVFEAEFEVELVDEAGGVVAARHVMATSGSGERGTFSATIPFDPARPPAAIVVFDRSAKDGSREHERRTPLTTNAARR